jgi:hypothetical protein
LSVTVSTADKLPLAVGLKTTSISQVAPALSVAPDDMGQLLVWEKSAAPLPVKAMLEMESAAVPVLVRVTSCGALAVFKGSPLNTRLLGWNPTPEATAVPVSATA